MDGKVNYPRFLLCKKPHAKIPMIGDTTIFLKVSRRAVFLQNSQGGTMGKFSKMSDFLGKLWKTKKMGTTGHIIA